MAIIEINGVKLDIDEREAVTIESYKVGSKVKVLVKEYSTYKVYPGVVVGFTPFPSLPTIEVMYINPSKYDSSTFVVVSINAETKDVELAPYCDAEILLDKQDVELKFANAIMEAQGKVDALTSQRDYFIERFAKSFEVS